MSLLASTYMESKPLILKIYNTTDPGDSAKDIRSTTKSQKETKNKSKNVLSIRKCFSHSRATSHI